MGWLHNPRLQTAYPANPLPMFTKTPSQYKMLGRCPASDLDLAEVNRKTDSISFPAPPVSGNLKYVREHVPQDFKPQSIFAWPLDRLGFNSRSNDIRKIWAISHFPTNVCHATSAKQRK